MKKYIFLLSLLLISVCATAQKEQYQGLFLYQFSKYIKWPDSYLGSNFTISVFGSENTFKSVESMAKAKKQTQGLSIVVRNLKTANELDHPQIVLIDDTREDVFNSVLRKLGDQPVLLVTDGNGLAQKGAIINFIEQDGKMRFELNKDRAEKIGLKISTSLINLAIVI